MILTSIDTNKVIGTLDAETGEWNAPGKQAFVMRESVPVGRPSITINSLLDSKLLADPVTLTSAVCPGPDITIGNFARDELTITVDNRDGSFDGIENYCFPGILVQTDESSFTVPAGATCYCETSDSHVIYGTSNGFYLDGTLVSNTSGDAAVGIYCDSILSRATLTGTTNTYIYNVSGSTFVVYESTTDTDIEAWEDRGFQGYQEPQGSSISQLFNYDGIVKTWDVVSGLAATYNRVPLGVFMLQNAAQHQDKLTLRGISGSAFDADATAFFAGIDYSGQDITPKVLLNRISRACGIMSDAVVNGDSLRDYILPGNPFADMQITYAQAVGYIAGLLAGNAKINRYGKLELRPFGWIPETATYVDEGVSTQKPITVTPDRIQFGTREMSADKTPLIGRLIYQGGDGKTYTSGTPTQNQTTYWMEPNPIMDYVIADSSASDVLDPILYHLHNVPPYYATSFRAAYADPRLEAGDSIQISKPGSTTMVTTPLTMITYEWCNMSTASYVSDGQRYRDASAVDGTYVTQTQLSDGYVAKSGDTMTGDLENTSVSNRRTVMQGNRFYAENTNNTAQNAALYYNGIAATNGANTATLTPTGLDLDGTTLTSAIGTQLRSNGTTSVPNSTWTATGSFTLAKGTWVIIAYTQFPNNTTGIRGMTVHQTAGSSSGQTSEYADCANAVGGTFVTRLRVVVTRVVGSNTTFYINAYQNSGSSQTVTWVYSCVRIL